MADWAYVVVRFVHVVAAIAWFGSGMAYQGFIMPQVRRLQGRARAERHMELMNKVGPFFGAFAGLTLLFGYELARRLLGSANPLAWWSSNYPAAHIMTIAAGLAVVAFILGPLHFKARNALRALLAKPWDEGSDRMSLAQERFTDFLDRATLLLLLAIVFLMVGSTAGGLS